MLLHPLKLMEANKVLARLISANGTMVQTLSATTLPDSARLAIRDQLPSL